MDSSAKHIIFCSTSYFEYDRRMQRIIHTLALNGYTCEWLSRFYIADSLPLPYVFNRQIRTHFKTGVLFYLEFNLKILALLLKSKANCISAVDLDTLPAAFLASKFRRKQLVFDAHEIFHEVPELLNRPLKKKVWKTLSSLLFPRIRTKYTVNKSLSDYFQEHFKSSFGIIRNVPHITKESMEPKKENKTMIYLGVLNKGRGLELAIHALTELEEFQLILVGEGDIENELRKLVTQNNLESRVHFMGYQKPEQLSFTLSNASFGINMLIPESVNYHLSLANKFFDYIHASLPSINMAFPEYKVINEEYKVSILTEEYTMKALLVAINKMYSENNYSELQRNCNRAKESYNWTIESQKLLKIYNTVL